MSNKTTSIMTSLLVSSLLSSCTLIPDFTTPELPVAEQLSATPISEAAEHDAKWVGWKDFFNQKELQDILQVTLENNRDLRVAALNVQAAQELFRIEQSNIMPSVTLSGESSRTKTSAAESSTGSSYITPSYSANVASTAFELDLFGRLRSQNQAALETFFAQEENKRAVQIALIAQTANAYLQWLADKKTLKLVDDTLNVQQKSYNLIEKSYKSGVASKLDLAQLRTALETARVNKALYTRKAEQGKNAIILLMGVKDGDKYLTDQSLDEIKLESTLPEQLSSEILLLRPDIKKEEHLLQSANADIGAARAAFFPTISLTGSLGFASRDLSDLLNSSAGVWSFAPQISVPIFKGGENMANLEFTQAQKDIAVANYEKSIQVAFKEVADELVAKKTLKEELKAQRQLVKATQETYDLSYARYKKGIDSFLNVLDAQRSLFSAQQNEVEVQRELISNQVNLYKALGGGVE